MKTEIIPLIDISPEDYRKCSTLNAGSRGQMRSDVAFLHRTKCKKTKVCLVKNEADLLLGWALCFPKYGFRYPEAHFYVRAKYRKRGIGKILMREVLKDNKKVRVCPHNIQSGVFFAEFRTSIIPQTDYWIKEGVKLRITKGCAK